VRRAPQRAIAPLLSHLALHLGPEAPRKSAISRPENPPTSSTCSTATKSSFSKLLVTSPCAGMLGTVPHHLQPPCCPYRCRNRKPFRAAGRGRPAGASGRRTQRTGTSIAADRAEDGGTLHPGHHNNIRASSAINRAQGEARQAAAWRRPACPGTERRGHLPCTMEKEMFPREWIGRRRTQASAACWAALTAAPALSAAALTCNHTPAAVGRVLGAERGRQTAHSRRWGRCDGGFADAPVVAPSRAGNRPSPQLCRRLAPGLRSLPS